MDNSDAPARTTMQSSEGLPAVSSNSLHVAAGAAAKLHHALGDPVPERALGFMSELWVVIVSFAKTVWRSVVAAWQPSNYLALAGFFIAGVVLSDFAMQYVRLFSALAILAVGAIVVTMLTKKTPR